jgi:GTP-binding protein HflX
MTRSNVDAEDKLFATLDPTSRRLRFPEDREIILTDTVGFIRDLPKDLVHAFRSTLDEALEADLLLHVVDAGDEEAEAQKATVDLVLKELGAADAATMVVVNKTDRADPERVRALVEAWDATPVSALSGDGLQVLLDRVERALFRERMAANNSVLAPATEP